MIPILYQGHNVILYSYPLFMGLGWGIAYQVFFHLLPREYDIKKAQLIFWGLFLTTWLGAKLFFYLSLPKDTVQGFLSHVSFWTGGGFVFYGGFLAALIFLASLRAMKIKLEKEMLWAMLPALAFGHAIGRIGCFLAGCCYGKVTHWWWGIFMHGHSRHPTQLLEAAILLLLGLYTLKSKRPKAFLVPFYILAYAGTRFVLEFLRGDVVRGEWLFLSPSQWVALFVGLGSLIFLQIQRLRR